jgi:uncharacterized protein (TIGR02145 family)
MKKLYLFVLLVPAFLKSFIHAQTIPSIVVPPGIPYQAVLRNADGQAAANNTVSTKFTLRQNTSDGEAEYIETHALTTNSQALLSAVIGQGTAVQGTFAEINWSNTIKFLQVEVDLGNGYVDLGTQQLMSVPFALYAANAPAGPAGSDGISAPTIQEIDYSNNKLFFLFTDGGIDTVDFVTLITGCTNPAACNYNPIANVDDNHCVLVGDPCNDNQSSTFNDVLNNNCECQGSIDLLGCTNPTACNYNASATIDNGTCLTIGNPCNDGNAFTFNDLINAACICAGTFNNNVSYNAGDGVVDIDGNNYNTVMIAGMEWMGSNLKVTKFSNGDPLITNLYGTNWQTNTAPAYGSAANNIVINDPIYGKLYNFSAVEDSRNICPTGWHVSTDAEWTSLINYLDPTQQSGIYGMQSAIAGGFLKGPAGWGDPNTGASNISGLNFKAGGMISDIADYYNPGNAGYYWTSTSLDDFFAIYRVMDRSSAGIWRSINYNKKFAFSIRCVKN